MNNDYFTSRAALSTAAPIIRMNPQNDNLKRVLFEQNLPNQVRSDALMEG
jgi:hypothetical protein